MTLNEPVSPPTAKKFPNAFLGLSQYASNGRVIIINAFTHKRHAKNIKMTRHRHAKNGPTGFVRFNLSKNGQAESNLGKNGQVDSKCVKFKVLMPCWTVSNVKYYDFMNFYHVKMMPPFCLLFGLNLPPLVKNHLATLVCL
jgi:hypothetical protein